MEAKGLSFAIGIWHESELVLDFMHNLLPRPSNDQLLFVNLPSQLQT